MTRTAEIKLVDAFLKSEGIPEPKMELKPIFDTPEEAEEKEVEDEGEINEDEKLPK